MRWTSAAWRWAARRQIIRRISDGGKLRLLGPLHLGFLHASRRLACQMHEEWDSHHNAASLLAVDVCTACRISMGGLAKLSENQLHCCLKLLVPQKDGRDRVGTWGRSTPTDGRPQELAEHESHFIDQNTVWCALTGCKDGETDWAPSFTCFACNDLTNIGSKFRCDRPQWSSYYRSALVFPIRYAQSIDGAVMGNVGFLAFDSHKTNAFPGLPSIFDYRERTADYTDALHRSPAFHLGALFADTLGTFLGSAYELSLTKGDGHASQQGQA